MPVAGGREGGSGVGGALGRTSNGRWVSGYFRAQKLAGGGKSRSLAGAIKLHSGGDLAREDQVGLWF